MEDIIKGSKKESYIVKPFTIDCWDARTLDDGFSASIDDKGNLYLSVFVPLVSNEYLQRKFTVEELIRDTCAVKMKRYINRDIKKQYSLQVGKKLVLSLRIKKDLDNNISYYALCEEVEISNNYNFKTFNNSDFYDVLKDIIYNNENINIYKSVDDLMGVYSTILSNCLYANDLTYLYKGNFIKNNNSVFKKGCFTAPLRKRDSLINQYIFLKHLIDILKKECSNELLLFHGMGNQVINNNGDCKIKKTG